MALNIKNEDGLWTLEISEKFAYETKEELEKDLKDLLNKKEHNGNYKQLKNQKRENKAKAETTEFLELGENIIKTIKARTKEEQ